MVRAALVDSCWPTIERSSAPYASPGRVPRRASTPSGLPYSSMSRAITGSEARSASSARGLVVRGCVRLPALGRGTPEGYMVFNDLSARDYQFKTPQWMPGKVFDGAAPCGPALVTADEAGPHDGIEIELRLNGELMQKASTADLVHSVPALVSYLSKLMTLDPGDVIATGTPAGVGSLRDPRVWLKHGDHIVISSPQLGVLETRIA